MIAAPITGENGPLGVIEVYSKERDAFTEIDASLIEALAGQAAIAITNARLIEELARSREALGRTAEAERTLREIAARVSAMRDKDEILQSVIDASVRLLGATGAMIDMLGGVGMAEAWTSQEAGERAVANLPLLDEVELQPDAGVSGRAVRTRVVEWTGNYLEDDRFEHTPARDAFVREAGIRSVIAAPLIHRDVVVGAITVYGDRADAFDEADAGLLAALADQAAVAIANSNLIEELERSQAETTRRADAERTLREIAARVSAILDPAEVLQRITDEAARLLDSDGARIDQYDASIDALRWSYSAGDAMSFVPDWAKAGGIKPGQAVAGLSFAEQRPVLTTDYLVDERFDHQPEIDEFVTKMGIRAVMSTPLSADAGPIGTLSVVSRQPGAYEEADLEVLTALATQASIAIRNARLMEELARSRDLNERRAEAEHALREIAARITAIREPGDLLQRIVDEALRLLRADGAVIDEFDPVEGVLIAAYDAGLSDYQRESAAATRIHVGEGLAGKAMAEGRVISAGDYLHGDFTHVAQADEMAARSDIGDLVVAPIIGDEGPLGAIEVYSHEVNAFDPLDEAIIGGLADQAAIAITNARLIEELERSRVAIERRADTERSLRDITARIAALRDPGVILERVVEEAKRLLGTDGAHLTRMSDDATYLVPVVVAGGADPEFVAWLKGMQFPLGGGINGLAALERTPVSTVDYLLDDRIPQEPEDIEVARRLGLRGMAAAPLRAPGGDVIGTLAVSSATPRDFLPDELDLLQGLADQAAIAITNSTLLERLSESEERYRFVVESSPDVVFATDEMGRFTLVSDAVERLTGRHASELIGLPLRGARPRVDARGRRDRLGRRVLLEHRGAARPRESPGGGRGGDPGRVHRHGPARRARPVHRGQRLRPRHARPRPARARPARIRGALPVPRRELTGRRLLDRPGGPLHVPVRGHGADDRLPTRRARRPAFLDGRPARLDGPRGGPLGEAGRRPLDRPGRRARPPRQGRTPDAGRGPLDRDAGCERRVRRDPRVHARHQRTRAPAARAARVRGALPLPRRVVARPRLGDRRGRHARLPERCRRDDVRPARGRGARPALLVGLRRRCQPRGQDPVPVAEPAPDQGVPIAIAVPPRRRA